MVLLEKHIKKVKKLIENQLNIKINKIMSEHPFWFLESERYNIVVIDTIGKEYLIINDNKTKKKYRVMLSDYIDETVIELNNETYWSW